MEVAPQIAARRQVLNLTLAQLSERSGVSKGMLSDVECGKKNPTVRILHQIALGLNCTISDLLGVEPSPQLEPIRRAERRILIDAGSGSERHLLSPQLVRRGIELVLYKMPAGARIDWRADMPGSMQHVTVLEGALRLVVGPEEALLNQGDSVTFLGDKPQVYEALPESDCRFILLVDSTQVGRAGGGIAPGAMTPSGDHAGNG